MDKQHLFPLSFPQKDIYNIHNFYQGNSINNVMGSVSFESNIDISLLRKAMEQLIKENDAFQLRFKEDNGDIYQYVDTKHHFSIIEKNFLNDYKGYEAWIRKMNHEEIDVFGDLYIFVIYTDPNGKIGYYFRLHHIISDAWTMTFIIDEIRDLYLKQLQDENTIDKNPPYIELLEREEKYIHSKRFTKDREFWKEEFATLPETKLLDYKNTKQDGESKANRLSFTISKKQTTQIQEFCKMNNVSIFTFFLSCISTYFYKTTNKKDFVLGTVILNRATRREKNTVGMFINSIPIRIQVEDELSFLDLNQSINKKFLKLLRHQKYPSYLLMDDLRQNQGVNANLYDVMVSYQNATLDNEKYPTYKSKWHFNGHSLNPLTFHINDRESTGNLELNYDYLVNLFTKDEIETMHKYLTQVIGKLVEDDKELIKNVEILNQNQVKELVKNTSDVNYPQKSLHELFNQQVAKNPASIALESSTEKITYQELDEKSNQLARFIRERDNIQPNDIVALYFERSIDMIVAVLAVLKSGAAYLPIDPNFPKERIDYMVSNSDTQLLLTTPNFIDLIKEQLNYSGRIINILDERVDEQETKGLPNANSPEDLAYIIYTSGSTGNPKGVMIEHRNVVQLLINNQNLFEFTNEDVWSMFHSYCFDFSVWEMYGALLYGGKLVIVPPEITVDPEAYINLLIDKKVTILNQTPSAFYNLIHKELGDGKVNDFKIRQVIFGGETLTPIKLKEWKLKYPHIQLINMYGITETTVHVTYKKLTMEDINHNIPNIGRPLPPLDIYILDKNLKMQPKGTVGEICVTGEGVARGYLNNEKFTNDVFVDNPYIPGTKLYRSGDLGRILPTGEIEYVGREDFQVKIRGFRVELGEIERELLTIDSVKECVVLNHLDKSENNILTAYVLLEEDLSPFEIRKSLAEKLPEFMMPSKYIKVHSIPLTSNGKVNREELAKYQTELSTASTEDVETASNKVEEKLLTIWKHELQLDNVNLNDNFFHIGGHSLNASHLVIQIHKELGVKLSIGDIFAFPTIKLLAKHIQSLDRSVMEETVIQPLPKQKFYPTSSAEKRMFTLWQMDKQSVAYNMPGAFRVKGDVDISQLTLAVHDLVKHHDILRSTYHTQDQELSKKIHRISDGTVELKTIDYTETELTPELVESLIEPFDLENECSFRVYLLKQAKNEFVLFIDMHHIISDAFTVERLMQDLSSLYKGEILDIPELQYQDYSAWEQQYRKSKAYQKQQNYWLNQFKDNIPMFQLPTDYSRSHRNDFKGNSMKLTLDKKMYRTLKEKAQSLDLSVYMYLLACYKVLLSKWTANQEVVLGVPVNVRHTQETKNMLGMFVNTIVLRDEIKECKPFAQLAESVKGQLIKALDNQQYSFDDLVQDLQISGQSNRTPIIDTVFVWNEDQSSHLNFDQIHVAYEPIRHQVERFDITFQVNENNTNIEFEMSYSESLYSHETIKELLNIYKTIVLSTLQNEDSLIKDIALTEKNQQDKYQNKLNEEMVLYPREYRAETLFEYQAQLNPMKIALNDSEEKVTYQELDYFMSNIALNIVNNGIPIGSRIGIIMENSANMIAALIGVLKAGCTYVPIDSDYPKDRIKYILDDSECELILTDVSLAEEFKNLNIPMLAVVKDYSNRNYKQLKSIAKQVDAQQPMYIIYTSGSTGNPKGVVVRHYSVNRLVKNTNYIEITKEDNLLQLSNLSFDGSVFDVYGALLNGAELTLISKESMLDLSHLEDHIKKNGVSMTFMTTALFNTIVERRIGLLKHISNKILFGGERVSVKHVEKAFQLLGSHRLIHVYGPTEGTVYSSYFAINESLEHAITVPIGKALSNTELYVLDKEQKLCPPHIPGELYIGGDGLAEGYLNLAKMNTELFVPSPFNKQEKLYRTGDLVYIDSTDNLIFLDRIDTQVKIRGHRIELSEIEQAFTHLTDVKEVYVESIKDENNNDIDLVAYVVAENEIHETDVANNLPSYMVPSYIMHLDELPLNQNGKIDRKLLPKPERTVMGNQKETVNFENQDEKQLAVMWEENLETSQITREDHYFQIGGHSLKAAILADQISYHWQIEFTVKDVLENPILKNMSNQIQYQTQNENQLTIKKAETKETYLLSFSEKSVYFIWMKNKSATAYNIPTAIQLNGELDVEALKSAFGKLIERHESFRTTYHMDGDEPYKVIHDSSEHRLELLDFTERKEVSPIRFIEPFNLHEGELIRGKLIKYHEENYMLFIDIHHIAADGFTVNMIYQELAHLYNGEQLEPLEYQYKDFSEWQQTYMASVGWNKEKTYWLNEFADDQPILNLPTDFERKNEKSYRGREMTTELNQDLIEKLNKLAVDTDSTLYMIFMSIYGLALGRYANQDKITIGTPTSGRVHSTINDVAGMFVNSLPVKLNVANKLSVKDYLTQSKQKILNALQYQNYSLVDLVDQLNVSQTNNRNPLFDVMFAMNYTHYDQVDFQNLDASIVDIEHGTEKFDMTLELNYNSKEEGTLILTYDSDLFEDDTMKNFLDSFIAIAWQLTERTELSDVVLTTTISLETIEQYNQTADKYSDWSIIEKFENQAENNQNVIALEYLDKRVTYKKLQDKVGIMASVLQKKGVREGSHVAIVLERSEEYVVSVLAVLKLGAVFIPIDTQYPEKRKYYIIKDSLSEFVITHSSQDKEWLQAQSIIIVDELKNEPKSTSVNVPNSNIDDILYILYTSGSTGQPKGVKIKEKSLINYTTWAMRQYRMEDSNCNMPLFTSISFDLTLTSMFVPLLTGSTVTIYPETDKEIIEQVFQNKSLDIVKLTPGYLRILNNYQKFNNHIHTLVVGGEALSTDLCQSITNRYSGIRIFNEYGPTEATVGSIVHQYNEVEDNKKTVLIGKPVNNTNIFILDPNGNIQPPGALGEIHIAGAQLSAGYLNNPQETKERFIYDEELKMTLYRTGDYGRLNNHGKMEYFGRVDNQVKVRGYRIELAEIETQLLKMTGIQNAVVLDRRMPNGDVNLACYIVSQEQIDTEDIRNDLMMNLPTYMVPSYYVFVDQIPLTNNGKVDTARLPDLSITDDNITEEIDLTEEEAILMQLVKKVLNVNKLSIRQNFFEVGGNSLSAVYLINEIVKVFGVKLEISDVFSQHSLKDLASRIKDRKNSIVYKKIPKIYQNKVYQVAYPQKRMFLIQYMNPMSTEYNMPIILNFKKLDSHRVESVLNAMVNKYRILKTNFKFEDGHVLQKARDKCSIDIQNINTSIIDTFDFSHLVESFDLSEDILLRAVAIKNGKGDDRLFLDIHHIVMDGVSMNQFVEEFLSLYHSNHSTQKVIGAEQIDYIDYIYWYNERLQSSVLQQQESYWLKQFSDFNLSKSLPYDGELASTPNSEGSQFSVEVSPELNGLLNDYIIEHSTTKYIVLLTALFTLTHKYNPMNEPIIGTPVSGRNHPDVNDMLGLFINTLAIKSSPVANETVEHYLERVKEKFLQSLVNADYQYDQLINHPEIRKTLQNEDLFELMFVYHNYDENKFVFKEQSHEIVPLETNTSKFNLSIAVVENSVNQLDRIVFEFKDQLFTKETIENMSSHYMNLLEQMLRQNKTYVSDLALREKTKEEDSSSPLDFSFEF